MVEKLYYLIFLEGKNEYLKDKDGRVVEFIEKEKAKEESQKYQNSIVCRSGLLDKSIIIQ